VNHEYTNDELVFRGRATRWRRDGSTRSGSRWPPTAARLWRSSGSASRAGGSTRIGLW